MKKSWTNKVAYGLAMSAASVAWAQNPPPGGIDPVVVRLNGLSAITQDVVPFLVDQQGLGHFEQGQVNLLNTNTNITIDFGDTFGSLFDFLGDVTLGVRFESFLRSVVVDVPIDDNSIAASFRTATAPQGRVRATINVPNAALDTTLRVRTRLNVDLPDFIPDQLENGIMALTNITDDFPIGVDGLSLTLQVLLQQGATGITISQVEQFTPQVTSVSVTDSSGLVSLANTFSVAINRIFGLPGTGSVNSLATTLTNNLIRDNADIRDMFRTTVNTALNRESRVRGYSGTLPNLDGIPLSVSYALSSFATRINNMASNWNVSVTATDPIALPNLAYSYLPRTAQTLSLVGAAGDLQAFLPLSLFDKFGHELARKGLFSVTMNVPAQGSIPAFSVRVAVNGTPRAIGNTTPAGQVKWQIPIGIANVGTLAPNTPRFQNVTATLEVIMSLNTDDRNGLGASIEDVSLASLSGTVRIGTVTVPIGGFRDLLEEQIFDSLAEDLPQLTLVPKVTNIMPPFAVSVGTVSVGSQYVNVPLTLEVAQ